MLGVAVVGAIAAGAYGALHDQVTYTISSEYFTRLKFHQFHYADFGFSDRVLVSEIGFLATSWVGFFCGWFLARRLIPGQPRPRAFRQISVGCAVIVACALVSAGIGYVYGLWRGPDADYSSWNTILDDLGVAHELSFVRVAYIHNAGYLGGLIGLVLALVLIRPGRTLEVRGCRGLPPTQVKSSA